MKAAKEYFWNGLKLGVLLARLLRIMARLKTIEIKHVAMCRQITDLRHTAIGVR